MSTPATDPSRRGSVLFAALVLTLLLLGLLYASSAISTVEVRESRRAIDELRARHLAEAGVERGLFYLAQAVRRTRVHDPLRGLGELFAASSTLTPFQAEPLLDGNVRAGSYTVSLTRLEQTPSSVTIALDASGYLPDAPSALAPGQELGAWQALRATVRYRLAPSAVFDYAYFIDNWGWFYGGTFLAHGNVRSNGPFDAAGYAPTITGQPLYADVHWDGTHATLARYTGDQGHGLEGGGVFSGWGIVGAQDLQGPGGKTSNQHAFQAPLSMPSLTDLVPYETRALQEESSITIGGITVSNAVFGDEPGERQNLYLVGTAANPIALHGAVVVRGDLVISGVVSGQGAIYSGGNVYVPNSITCADPPATRRPADDTQAATEQWLSDGWNKDFLGLFARENVVIGDFTHPWWQFYEGWWMGDSMNSSVEDAGVDNIPNTRAGKDGVAGTADDDLLEGDGVFSIQHYTRGDADGGLIPAGKSVGDPIPGTGEDIDGDGVFDSQASLANVLLTTPLDAAHFGGNLPAGGIAKYSDIASLYASHMDAVFYTDHSFCWLVLGGSPAQINGALVSRNENIVCGTPTIEINHDARLLGGASGMAAHLLPLQVQPVEVLRWVTLDHDPNRRAEAP